MNTRMTQLLTLSQSSYNHDSAASFSRLMGHGRRRRRRRHDQKTFSLLLLLVGKRRRRRRRREEKEVVQHCGNFLTSFSSGGGIGFMQQLRSQVILFYVCLHACPASNFPHLATKKSQSQV